MAGKVQENMSNLSILVMSNYTALNYLRDANNLEELP